MPMLGLGNSIGTPPGGIEADVVVVGSFDELTALGDAVLGKIVLFDVPFTTYGATVQYRSRGADAASRQGAVAALVRSVTPVSLSTPHTGAMRYSGDEGTHPLPAAAVSVEDAGRMRRLQERGTTPRVRLEMSGKMDGEAPSANVVGEVRGRTKPHEIVVLGCHLDSWDVGTGAQDDGAGCVVAMEAARLISTLDRKPARTIRVVLYTNEENGLKGAAAYATDHADELEHHVAAIESDTGAGRPLGYRVHIKAPETEEDAPTAEQIRALAVLNSLVPLLEPLGATATELNSAGADMGPLISAGVPGLGMRHDMTGYWPIHHTEADTVDKIDEILLRKNVASMAVVAYALADREGRITD
jgi:carboxypeptidase Q